MDEGTRDDAYREDVIQGAAGSMYAAGTDTVCSIYILFSARDL